MPSSAREFIIQVIEYMNMDPDYCQDWIAALSGICVDRDADLIRAAKEEMRERAAQFAEQHWGDSDFLASSIRALPINPPAPDAEKEKL